VAAHIGLPSINTDAWDAVSTNSSADAGCGGAAASAAARRPRDRATPGGGYAPTTLALPTQDLAIGSRHLTKVVAGLSQEDGVWRANVDADQLNGYVEYRAARRGPARACVCRLSRLSLPKSDAEGVENLLEQPATVPALDIVVDDLELRGKRLGPGRGRSGQPGSAPKGANGGLRAWR
jgi:uncharacterized protein YhdP